MTKRITALLLILFCLAGLLAGCHDKKIDGEVYKGAEIPIYLCDQVFDLDPALCLVNDSAYQICSLLYDTLFKIDSNGKIQKSLVESYEIKKDEKNKEYSLFLSLRKDTFWSDGIYISAEDVVYSWKRILDPAFSSDACCLLYQIKNARQAKQGDCSIDDDGVNAEFVFGEVRLGNADLDAFSSELMSAVFGEGDSIEIDFTLDVCGENFVQVAAYGKVGREESFKILVADEVVQVGLGAGESELLQVDVYVEVVCRHVGVHLDIEVAAVGKLEA